MTYKDNKPTGALPGRLIRNPKTAAVRAAGAVSELDLGDRQANLFLAPPFFC